MGMFKYKHKFNILDAESKSQGYVLISNQSLQNFDSTRIRILRGSTVLIDELLNIPDDNVFGPHDLPITLEGRALILRHGYSPTKSMKTMFQLIENETVIYRSREGEFGDGGKLGRFMIAIDNDNSASEAKDAARLAKRKTRPDWLNLILDGVGKFWPWLLGGAAGYAYASSGFSFDLGLPPLLERFFIPALIFGGIMIWLLIKFIRA